MKPVPLIAGLLAAIILPAIALGESMETFTLKAGSVQATFRLTGKGGITSLRASELELVQPGWEHPTLFRISLVERRKERSFTSSHFDRFGYEKTPSGIRFTYSGLEGADLKVTATVEAKGDYLAFTSQVRCGPETVCSTLEYPYIIGYQSLSGNPDDDRYLYPKSSGSIYRNPAREARRNRRGMIGLLAYPGTQGVQFHALYNQNGGIVMYAADPECNPKRFTIRHDREHDSAAWLVLHYFDETPGFVFKQDYEVRIQASGPSWFDAADVYAEWGRKQWWMKKKVDFPQWILRMPILANVHDNENWGRVLPSWIAEHQPEMNKLLGDRPLVHQFQRWEHYGQWIAPDSFPPLGGEEAMIEASKKVRSWGNHLKHLFSSGQYWLHEDITDEYFEKHVKNMAIMPRGGSSRKAIVGKHPYLGEYVLTCPSSEEYHQKLVHLVSKLCDCHHDFISMDIWPAMQPRTCHNPRHDHPPGLGRWYVDGNIKLLNKLHATVYAREPQAVFGGEYMAEPYMPWMHVALMRSAMAPIDPQNANVIHIPLFDYIYGDQIILWGGYATTRFPEAKDAVAIQFVRGKLIHIEDKWSPRYFDREATMARGDPARGKVVLKKGIEIGDDAARASELAFAAKANDLQRGPFNPYFARGRLWRFPEAFAKSETGQDWRKLVIYDRTPAVGAFRHPENENKLWAFANPSEENTTIRLLPIPNKSVAATTLKNKPRPVAFRENEYLEVVLEPLELAVIEWK